MLVTRNRLLNNSLLLPVGILVVSSLKGQSGGEIKFLLREKKIGNGPFLPVGGLWILIEDGLFCRLFGIGKGR